MTQLTFTIDRGAVVLVWDNSLHKPIGTGFALLRPDWIVTAKHVVIHQGLPRNSLSVQYARGGFAKARVHIVHPEIDVALIQVDDARLCEVPLFPSYEGHVGGNGLLAVGYKPSLNHENHFGVEVNLITDFTMEHRCRSSSDEDVIVFDAPFIERGHSGGPLLGEGGGVVGLVLETFDGPSCQRARATSIRSLIGALDFRADWKVQSR